MKIFLTIILVELFRLIISFRKVFDNSTKFQIHYISLLSHFMHKNKNY